MRQFCVFSRDSVKKLSAVIVLALFSFATLASANDGGSVSGHYYDGAFNDCLRKNARSYRATTVPDLVSSCSDFTEGAIKVCVDKGIASEAECKRLLVLMAKITLDAVH